MLKPYLKKLIHRAKGGWKKVRDNKLLATLLADVSEKDIPIIKPLLENQLKYLNESYNFKPERQTFNLSKKFLMNLVKQTIIKNLVLRNIIGIQPMTGPVGSVFVLQYKQSPYTNKELGITEDDGKKTSSLEVVSHPVAAMSRTLRASWTPEAAQDLFAAHGIDMEHELTQAMACELSEEAIEEVINDLVAGSPIQSVDEYVEGKTVTNEVTNVMLTINHAANQIAQQTRRGAGNMIITSPIGVSILQCINLGFRFKPIKVQSCSDPFSLGKVGDLVYGTKAEQGKEDTVAYQVYSSLSHALTDPTLKKVKFIVGYKGKNGEIDTGYILAPYVPLMSTGVCVDPVIYQPVVKFMTRYGKWIEIKAKHESKYYRCVEFTPKYLFNEGDVPVDK